MQAFLEQLSQIIVFAGLETAAEKIGLQPYIQVQSDRKREIIAVLVCMQYILTSLLLGERL